MNKSILMLAGVAVLTTGAFVSSYLFAQQPAAQPSAGTKVACINVGEVFSKYKRAIAFKDDLEKSVAPFKEKGKKLVDEIKKWQEEVQTGKVDPSKRDQYEAGIKNNKRTLEDMQAEIQKLIGERQKANMMTLWKEINMGIKAVADSGGYQVVLAYGDPVEKDAIVQFDNVSRKMNAMDQGALIPIHVHPSADISDWVTRTLNSWVDRAAGGGGGGVTPAGGKN